jgi:hypothetical protein
MTATHSAACVLALATAFCAGLAPAQMRQADPHQHGHGTLEIVIVGTVVEMALEVPAADILGFEHEARTPEQIAAVEKGRATLSEPLTLFEVPEAAGCMTYAADVDLTREGPGETMQPAQDEAALETGEAHSSEGHSHGEAGHSHGEEGHSHGEGGHAEAGGADHAEFFVTYRLTCAVPAEMTQIDFAYFETFPNAEELEVRIATDRGERRAEVSRDQPMMSLLGLH